MSLRLALKDITRLKGFNAFSILSKTFARLIISYAPTDVALVL